MELINSFALPKSLWQPISSIALPFATCRIHSRQARVQRGLQIPRRGGATVSRLSHFAVRQGIILLLGTLRLLLLTTVFVKGGTGGRSWADKEGGEGD